jgi:dolichyl-phosphate-mannose--protein O-mannosyl transferase
MEPTAPASRQWRTMYAIACAVLLSVLAAELLLSTRQLSQTFDEAAHLYAGYQHWRAHDYGVNPEHPPLVKLAAAAPLLPMHLVQPHPPNPFFMAEEYIGGEQLMAGNNREQLLSRGRTAAALFTLLLALLVFFAAYEMFGPVAGLLALLLFTFEPTLLAHGALITTDMGVAAFVFAAVYAFYRYLKRPGWGRGLVFAVALGLALWQR